MNAMRAELHDLVDELPEEEISAALAEVRRHVQPVDQQWPPAWFGIAPGDGTSVRKAVQQAER